MTLQLCSLQRILGPVLEARLSSPETALGPSGEEESWERRRQESVIGLPGPPSQPSRNGEGEQHCRLGRPWPLRRRHVAEMATPVRKSPRSLRPSRAFV